MLPPGEPREPPLLPPGAARGGPGNLQGVHGGATAHLLHSNAYQIGGISIYTSCDPGWPSAGAVKRWSFLILR